MREAKAIDKRRPALSRWPTGRPRCAARHDDWPRGAAPL